NSSIIIGGDWNFSMISGRRENNAGNTVWEPTMLALDLFDVATAGNLEMKSTFYGYNCQSKIDRIYVTKSQVTVLDCTIQNRPSDFTDHCFVLSRVQLNNIPVQGPSFWKLNPAILSDNDFVLEFSERIKKFGNLNALNWDHFKEFCRSEFKLFTRERNYKYNWL